ncbi:MAG: PA14 domain-containing protein [Anaerolineae bacterium]
MSPRVGRSIMGLVRPVWLIGLAVALMLLVVSSAPPALAQSPLPDKFLFAISAQPLPPLSPYDVAVGPDSIVYVSDSFGSIQRFTASGVYLGKWSGDLVGAGPDGTVYVTTDRVQHLSHLGTVLGEWDAAGNIVNMAVGPDGTVYAVTWGNNRIERYTASGVLLGMWGSHGSAAGQFDYPTDVAVAPDGTVYVVDQANQRIQRFTAAGAFLSKWGRQGGDDGQFNYPIGIAVAPDGTVYVTDTNNYRVQHFTATGAFLGKLAGSFQAARSAAVAPDGTVYVADGARLQRFTADGVFLSAWPSSAADGRFDAPVGVAVAPNGALYVADMNNHRIQHFAADGLFLGTWSTGDSQGLFSGPGAVAVGPSGAVYVVESSDNRIERFTAEGALLGSWGSGGSGDGQFSNPGNVAVAPDDTVYVTDTGNNRVEHFTSDGGFLNKFGEYGAYPAPGDGQFSRPGGVAVGPDGTVYVVDAGNVRIQRFTAQGAFLGKWGSQGGGDGQFGGLAGITVGPDGTVYVGDWGNGCIQQFTPDGVFLGKWGSQGSADGQFRSPSAIAIARNGTVYVADPGNNRVEAFGAAYPSTWRSEYYPNAEVLGPALTITTTESLDFDWGTAPPAANIPAQDFSARFQRFPSFADGTYVFSLRVQGGARLWVDGQLLIDRWDGPDGTYTGLAGLSAGAHNIHVEYHAQARPAALQLAWQAVSFNSFLHFPLMGKEADYRVAP